MNGRGALPEAAVTTLPSGLRIASQSVPGTRTAAVGVWVHTGARNEPEDRNGISHLLEHMAFKGTTTRTARQIAEEVESAGAYMNAYTGREETAYHLRILPGAFPLAVDVLSDILLNPTFADEELARERSVIIQEIGEARDNPADVVFDRFQTCAYPDQPLGRPILGTPEIVSGIERETLLAYMRQHYRGEAMVLAAAGEVDHEALVNLGAAAFEDIGSTRSDAPAPARYHGGVGEVPRELEQTHLVLGFEGVAYADPDFYAMTMFSAILGGGLSSRLFQEVREKRGLAYDIHSFGSSFHDSGIFGVYAGTAEQDAGEVIRRTAEEIHGVAGNVRPDELDRAMAQARSGLLMGLESCAGQAEALAHQLRIHGRPIPVDEHLRRLADVDRAAVSRIARRVLASEPTLAAIGPLGGLPTNATLRSLFGTPVAGEA